MLLLTEPEPIDAEFEEIIEELKFWCEKYAKTIELRGFMVDMIV